MTETRLKMVLTFFEKFKYRPYWCKARICACMGCVNKFPKNKEWKSLFPDDHYLTEEDIIEYNKLNHD